MQQLFSQFIRTPNTAKPTRNISALLLRLANEEREKKKKERKEKGCLGAFDFSAYPAPFILPFLHSSAFLYFHLARRPGWQENAIFPHFAGRG